MLLNSSLCLGSLGFLRCDSCLCLSHFCRRFRIVDFDSTFCWPLYVQRIELKLRSTYEHGRCFFIIWRPSNFPEKWTLAGGQTDCGVLPHQDQGNDEIGMMWFLRKGMEMFQWFRCPIFLHSCELTKQWKMDPLKMIFLLKMVIFHCYVSWPEGICTSSFINLDCFSIGLFFVDGSGWGNRSAVQLLTSHLWKLRNWIDLWFMDILPSEVGRMEHPMATTSVALEEHRGHVVFAINLLIRFTFAF